MRITRKYGDCMADGGVVKKKKPMKKPESGGKPKRITTPGKPGDSGPGGAHPGRNREKKANGGLAGNMAGMAKQAGAQRAAVAAKPAAAKPAGGGYGSRMRQASGRAQSAMGRNRPAAAKPAAARPPRPVRGAQRRADGGKVKEHGAPMGPTPKPGGTTRKRPKVGDKDPNYKPRKPRKKTPAPSKPAPKKPTKPTKPKYPHRDYRGTKGAIEDAGG